LKHKATVDIKVTDDSDRQNLEGAMEVSEVILLQGRLVEGRVDAGAAKL
jgi:hypothetical protein